MDIVLVPSTLTLTSKLFRLRAGSSDQPELLQTNVEWEYSIPPLHRDEFYFQGSLSDTTPPVYVAVGSEEACFVRQLPGRLHDNPAFEILYDVSDGESMVFVTLGVGSYEHSNDVVPTVELGGNGGLTVFNGLLPAIRLYFTITATNLNGLQSFASCSLSHFYDRSPPLARINPVGTVSSNPSAILALVVLFDEFGLLESQEVAIGRLPGRLGDDVLPWTPFNTSLISTPPAANGDILNLFSFGRVSHVTFGLSVVC